jgi:amino acid transporter
MLIIANAYRRLNLRNANYGASFERVGRAINPYLGFITGWLMVRSRVFSNAWDGLAVGILPILACVFLGWILVKSLLAAPASQLWWIGGIIAVGLVLMFSARFLLRSPFFQAQRESATPGPARS